MLAIRGELARIGGEVMDVHFVDDVVVVYSDYLWIADVQGGLQLLLPLVLRASPVLSDPCL